MATIRELQRRVERLPRPVKPEVREPDPLARECAEELLLRGIDPRRLSDPNFMANATVRETIIVYRLMMDPRFSGVLDWSMVPLSVRKGDAFPDEIVDAVIEEITSVMDPDDYPLWNAPPESTER